MTKPRVGRAPYLRNTSGRDLDGKPLAFSHRGFAPDGEENTLKAFRAAWELGFRYLETDVHTSKDGVLMVFHDETLQRLTGMPGAIADHTAAQLVEFRVGGEPIPTFEQLLLEFPRANFNVDLKDAQSAEHFAELIEKHRAHDRVLIASFRGTNRVAAQKRIGRPVATSPGLLGVSAATLLGKVVKLPAYPFGRFAALQVPEHHGKFPVLTPAFLRNVHAAGLQVHVWVVNEAADMHRLLDMGVDGIMSDRADTLAAVMRARGNWPQNGSDD